MTTVATPACVVCGDSGWRRLEGTDRVRICECRLEKSIAQNFALAGIPKRYTGASLSNFQLDGPQARFEDAHLVATQYAASYPLLEDNERSLLLIGTAGTGKTHLAVGILKELLRKGVTGRFYDYQRLLEEIRCTYSPESAVDELQILGPALAVEVMVLDDLGAMRPSPWVLDMVTLLLNARYNQRRTTIVTTNYPDRAAGPALPGAFDLSLQDRVGERVVSRLREMCRRVTMEGPDYRFQRGPAARLGASA